MYFNLLNSSQVIPFCHLQNITAKTPKSSSATRSWEAGAGQQCLFKPRDNPDLQHYTALNTPIILNSIPGQHIQLCRSIERAEVFNRAKELLLGNTNDAVSKMDCADNQQKSCPLGAYDNLGGEGVISNKYMLFIYNYTSPSKRQNQWITSKSRKWVLFLATEIEDLLMPA